MIKKIGFFAFIVMGFLQNCRLWSYHNFFFRNANDITSGQLPNARLDSSSVTLQGNTLSLSTNIAQINTVITSSQTTWLPLDSSTNTKVGGLTLNGQINSVIVSQSSVTTQGNTLSLSTNIAQINAIITSSNTLWLPLDSSTNTKIGGITLNGQINSVIVTHSSVTTQGNTLSLSTNIAQVNTIITSSSTIWLPLDTTTNTKTGGLTINGQINNVIISHSSTTTQGNSISISTNAGLVNSIYSSSGTTFLLLDNSTNTKLGGLTVGGNVTATAFSGSASLLTGLSAVINPYRFVAATAASQSGTHIGANQTSIIAISTTLEVMGGGTFIVREGSYTFTAGATIPWNVTMQGQGRATKIALSGAFEAFVVSGTLKDIELIIPGDYRNNGIYVKSSGTVENITVTGGPLSLGGAIADLSVASVFNFETQGQRMLVRNVSIDNIGTSGAGGTPCVFKASNTTSLWIDRWRVYDFSSGSNGNYVFLFVGGKYVVENGYFYGRNGLLGYDGASSGTWWNNNDFEIYGAQNFGAVTQLGLGGMGHIHNMNWINNRFYTRDKSSTAAPKFLYFQAIAARQIRGGQIKNNTFQVSGADAFQPGTDSNVIGLNIQSNLFMSSATVTDSGSANVYRDNYIIGSGAMYPRDTTTQP